MNQVEVIAKSQQRTQPRFKLSQIAISSLLMLSATCSGLATSATYDVVPVSTNDLAINVFARALDNQNNAIVLAQDAYNVPLDYSLIDFTNTTLLDNLTDPTSAEAGNPNTDDYNYLVNLVRLTSSENVSSSQQIALYQSFINDGLDNTRVTAFDIDNVQTNGLSFSNDIIVNDILNANVVVGAAEAPYITAQYTNEDGDVLKYLTNDFLRRAFISFNGNTIALPPAATDLGGISEAYSVNQNLQVAGSSSIRATADFLEAVANCDDNETRGDQPIGACYRVLMNSGLVTAGMDRRATIWQLDAQGQIISTTTFPLPFTPEEVSESNPDTAFFNAAYAINDAGIAVGETHTFFYERELKVSSAALYQNNETIEFIDKEDYFPSTALDINNNNIVVGSGTTQVNGTNRSKFYTYNIDTEELIFPEDFFPGSASVARDINDNNMVVGEGEVEFITEGTRRKNAFLYDMNTQTFTDLNDLIACDAPYIIVGANSINDDNIILANALVNEQARNPNGDLVVDSDGEPVMVDRVIAVRLNPIPNGIIEDCSNAEEETVIERQGASVSVLTGSLFVVALLGKLLFRRRRHFS